MKKKICSILAGVLLATNVWAAPNLNDISGHWCEKIIEKWVDAEKINGYPSGEFKPDNNITRAEYIKLLASLLPQMPYGEEVLYEDVKEEDWYFSSVEKLVTMGVLKNDGLFEASENINRLEVMTLAGKTFSAVSESELDFADADEIDDESKMYVAGLVEMGIVSGYGDNTLKPSKLVTRAEVVKILDGFGYVYDKNSLEGIMEKIYKGVEGFEGSALMKTRIDDETAQFFLGLENLEGIEEALASEPMISSVAHSVCLVRAKEGQDVEELKEKIRTSVDPRKWVCVGVERDEIVMANAENLILMVIDQNNPKAFADSFMNVALSLLPKIEADENGIMNYNGYYMDSLGTFNESSAENFAKNLDNFIKNNNVANAYFAAVPSKSYYVNDKLATPFDYEKMNSVLSANLSGAKFIDLYGSLSLEDYCKSDLHWKQERLQSVLNSLGDSMGFETDLSAYTQNEIANFKGYYAQKVEGVESESIHYLTNSITESATVDHFTVKDFNGIYNSSKLETNDPYTFFLSGAAPLITITNAAADSEKELVVLGDSFSLSLAPLLVESYKTVTLVDLRLISGKIVNEYVNLTEKDVLMIYSDAVINNSMMLKF